MRNKPARRRPHITLQIPNSGLGKTSLLREIAAKATRPVAFLHPTDCADGVDVAISRIIHDVQETASYGASSTHARPW